MRQQNLREYERPEMMVVKLQHQTRLLSNSSNLSSQRKDYGKANSEVDWTQEERSTDDGTWMWD